MEWWTWAALLGTSVWVLFDAKSIGVRRGLSKGFADLGPWGWFVACVGIWIVAFPLYLIKRPGLKRRAEEARRNPAPVAPEPPAPRRRISVVEWAGIVLVLLVVALMLVSKPKKTRLASPAPIPAAAPARAAAPAVKPAESGGFSSWMPVDAFGQYLGTVNFDGKWVRAVEGRWAGQGAEYRVAFEPLPEGASWYWWYGRDAAQFQQLQDDYAKDGYTLSFTQSFSTPAGAQLYQGIWTRR